MSIPSRDPDFRYPSPSTIRRAVGQQIPKYKTDYIRTLIGATGISVTPVDGITTDQRYGIPFLIYNGSFLDSYTADANWSFLTSIPPAGYGWQSISFISSDASGFQELANQTIIGNFSSVYLHTKDLTATNATHQIGVNYQVLTTDYPAQSAITSEIWEGALPADAATFGYFASLLPPTGFTTISSIPFTAHITQNPPLVRELLLLT